MKSVERLVPEPNLHFISFYLLSYPCPINTDFLRSAVNGDTHEYEPHSYHLKPTLSFQVARYFSSNSKSSMH